jgi:hypothetical protein
MPTKKKQAEKRFPFEVIEIKAKGKLLGLVYADDHAQACTLAIETFRIRRPETVKLIIRKIL